MDFDNDPRFYEENSENSAYYRKQEPIAPPKQKKKRAWLHVLFVVLIIGVILGGTVYSLYRVCRNLNVQIDRSEHGLRISVGEKLPEQTAPTAEKKEAPQTETAPSDEALHSDRKLNVSDSPAAAENIPSAQAGALSLQEIYEKIIPSVVSVVTDSSSGTGIVMSEDGYVITNYHVIDGAREITAILYSDESLPAALVGGDEASDLAVLKIDAEQALIPAEFGDSDKLRVGDSVVAVGDPLGTKLRGTMTDGIISAINRDLLVNDREMTLIQTNAALNNGNSGGPLINCYGQVIGVNAVKLSSSYFHASIEGLGFAIPISTAKPIVDELIQNGFVSGRPAIGISGEELPMAARFYYRLPEGIYVTYVDPTSDAAAKGIAAGDIITAAEGEPIATIDRLDAIKNRHQAGDTIELTVFSQGVYRELSVILMDAAGTVD